MCNKTAVVEHFDSSLRQLARADLYGHETTLSLLNKFNPGSAQVKESGTCLSGVIGFGGGKF